MLQEDHDLPSLATFENEIPLEHQSMHKVQISDYINKYFI